MKRRRTATDFAEFSTTLCAQVKQSSSQLVDLHDIITAWPVAHMLRLLL